jgi:hypothetical protein
MSEPTNGLEHLSTAEAELDCRLTADEIAAHGRDLVNLLGEIEEEEDDQDARKAEMRERLATMQARQSKIAGTIRRGLERRRVTVEIMADWTTQTAIERRTDTGEEIGRRPLREDEKQLKLPPDTAAAVGEAKVEHGEP